MIRCRTSIVAPSEEPPEQVRAELLWRLAVRLHQEHQPGPEEVDLRPDCATCHRPWPCSGQRMAELGLKEAKR
jgi:hypothetical protein